MERIKGSIETWQSAGYGIIRGSDQNTYLAHYTDFEAYISKKSKISMEIGQDVTFVPCKSGRGKAESIEYDSRSALFRFAHFPDYEGAIQQLALEFAVREKWSSSSFDEDSLRSQAATKGWDEQKVTKFVKRKQFDVLFSFIERTFERLQLEDKIIYSDSGAAFNTSLGNKFDKDVFAIFKYTPNKPSKYTFDKFTDANFVGKNFPIVPESPSYFFDIASQSKIPSDHLLLDCELKIFPDFVHLFDERRTRFPEAWREMSDDECASKFEQLLDRSRSRVRRNFRAAVPFYYPALKKIQMLLPITFTNGNETSETRALVVSREGAGYSAETIMPLEWAYKNARLVAKPDRDDWLDF
ncbi:DUF3825 domain-containing protein [Chitinilyticum aquatile]|uniref:DUF3825 domain-containing protein n=1 Tax=Chitinilyticum aquatile TaxID=362520 RepID=UPI00040AF2BA|nr:DUF3825 domain-containing protein [Chitinilyticum aquatile]